MSDNIIQLNQELIHKELKDLVRNNVEEPLNALPDHEAEELVNAENMNVPVTARNIVTANTAGTFNYGW